ncbi:MAG: YfcE family phosphodiesterase [Clostridia bacterium]|nr:YfcE family phosphodiesterase [Clostridia bacterium]
MKILVFSDSHGNFKAINDALELHHGEADLVIFLGDGARDISLIEEKYPSLAIFKVKGNCDFMCEHPTKSILNLDGVRILVTHGHEYDVKYSLNKIMYTGFENELDAVLFGHTHQPLDTVERLNERSLRLFNPGSIGMGKTYGVIDIINGVLITNIARL